MGIRRTSFLTLFATLSATPACPTAAPTPPNPDASCDVEEPMGRIAGCVWEDGFPWDTPLTAC